MGFSHRVTTHFIQFRFHPQSQPGLNKKIVFIYNQNDHIFGLPKNRFLQVYLVRPSKCLVLAGACKALV
jgi:hypothetical protein